MELFSTTGQWMEAFGKMLIHSIWAGLLLLLLMKVILHLISHQRSQLRYMVSLSTLLLFAGSALLFFLTLYQPSGESSGVRALSQVPGWMSDTEGIRGPLFQHSIWVICCYLYAAGIMIMTLRVGYAAYEVHAIKGSGTPVGESWNNTFSQLLNKLRIRKKVVLRESVRITTPGIIGWIRPVVLVPAGMLTQLPVSQVETILMHELFHLKRYDFLVNAIQIILEGMFFYNPAVWMISRTIQAEREHCCDDLVVGHCSSPLLYAKALFQISGKEHAVKRLVPAAGGAGGSGLSRRVLRILNRETMKSDIRDHLQSLMVFISVIAILLIVNGFTSGTSAMKPQGIEPGLEPDLLVSMESVEALTDPAPYPITLQADTVPEPELSEPEHAVESADIMTEEEMNKLMEEARRAQQEALEEIDWEAIKESMEEARVEALEEIDWEAIKESMEEARLEVMEEIDWEAIKESMEEARLEVMEEIDWEAIQQEMEESMEELREIDWDAMKKEIEESMKEIDLEQMRMDVEESIDEIDWDEIKMELEQMRLHLDSIKQELVWDPEHS